MLAVVPIVAIGAGIYGRKLRIVSGQVQDALAVSSEVAEETLAGVRNRPRICGKTKKPNATDVRSTSVSSSPAIGPNLVPSLPAASALPATAPSLPFSGTAASCSVTKLGFGQLTSFLLYTFTVAFSIGALSGLWSDFAKAAGASERVFELIDRSPVFDSRWPAVVSRRMNRLRLEGIDFAYRTRPKTPVLQNSHLELEPGRSWPSWAHRVAILKVNGGRTAVSAYDPQQGQICLDDHPYDTLDAHWLHRNQVGVVSQDAHSLRHHHPGQHPLRTIGGH